MPGGGRCCSLVLGGEGGVVAWSGGGGVVAWSGGGEGGVVTRSQGGRWLTIGVSHLPPPKN